MDYDKNSELIPFKLTNKKYYTNLHFGNDDIQYFNKDENKILNINLYKIKIFGINEDGIDLCITIDNYHKIEEHYYFYIYIVKHGVIQSKLGIYESMNNNINNLEDLDPGFIIFFKYYYDNKSELIEYKQSLDTYIIEVLSGKGLNDQERKGNKTKIYNIIKKK